jgi:hypothetical protein
MYGYIGRKTFDLRMAGVAAAIFALMGTLVGVLGTLAVELARSRRESVREQRDALRLACVDFTTAIARAANMAVDIEHPDEIQLSRMRDAHLEARICYERLRLTAASPEIQKAGRHVLRYSFGTVRQAEGRSPRSDELDRSPVMLLQDWLIVLYAKVRQELGVPQAQEVYREPDEWLAPLHIRTPRKNVEKHS